MAEGMHESPPPEREQMVWLMKRVDDLEAALEDIASGDWQRYPQREQHKQRTVRDYARWELDRGPGDES